MAFRTFQVHLANLTTEALTLDAKTLDHGIFTAGLAPPAVISPGEDGAWRGESSGFATGTAGSVRYQIYDTPARVTVAWSVPAVGHNTTELSIDDPTGQIVFFPTSFGYPLGGSPGLHAFPTPGKDTDTGPVAPLLPPLWNPYPDSGVHVGVRDHGSPLGIRLSYWVRFLGHDPSQGMRPILARNDIHNFSIKQLLGPPNDWHAPII
jgi:hypothetical protein